jgi:predicted alpha/beta-hydrolase family hydrolase
MEMIKTDSFELAVNTAGNPDSERFMLCLPGRLDTKDYAHIQSHVDYFAEKGFFTVSFDPPGTWESGDDISLYTTANYLTAINEIIAHFGNRPTVALGHSRGGTMALLAGVNNKYVTHMIAVMSHWGSSGRPETNEVVHISHRDLPPGTERTTEQKEFKLPMSYFNDDADYSGLDTCAKPKLFFVGRQDALVTLDDVHEMFASAAEPKQLIELESEHDYRLHLKVVYEVNKNVGEFLKSLFPTTNQQS